MLYLVLTTVLKELFFTNFDGGVEVSAAVFEGVVEPYIFG